jgi:very-short-patch-repair endonuclease
MAGAGILVGMVHKRLLTDNRGIVTRQMLRDAGATDHQIRRWLKAGALIALGRSMLAMPQASPDLVRAVSLGGRLACISAAKYRGIWTMEDGCFHVALRANHSHFTDDGAVPPPRVHWDSRPLDPLSSLPALESIRAMLAHVAACQPLDLAVAVFDSTVRKGMISLEELQQLASVRRGRFARVVSFASTQADSGLESATRVRLALAGIQCRDQVKIDGHRVDLLIGDRLIIQLDGKQHLKDPVELARDRAQDRRLKLMGYTVLRYGYAEVFFDWPTTFSEIAGHVARGAHRSA